jgi:hypothetical protein
MVSSAVSSRALAGSVRSLSAETTLGTETHRSERRVALDMISSRTFDGRIQLLEYVPTILTGPPGTNTVKT